MKRLALAISMLMAAGGAVADDLLQVYNIAQTNDPALRAAMATRDANLESRPIAKSALLPSVSATGDADYTARDVKDSTFGSYNDHYPSGTAAIQLVQPLYRKDLMVALEQADDQSAQAIIDYTTASQDLIVRVTQAYFGVLAAQDTLTFTEADVKAIERQLDQAKQRFDVGLIAITDVNEAQARYDQARADAILAQNDLDDAIESLREITLEPVTPLADLKPTVTSKTLNLPDPDSLEAWTDLALSNNPSIVSAKYNMEIAKKEIERQDAGDSPALDLVGAYSMTRTDANNGTDFDDATIGLQLTVPLYTGGGVQARTRQARHRYAAAQDLLEQQRRAIQTQVRNAYRGVLASISRVKALEATEVSAKSALEATEAGFEVGTRTLVDVLNSQRNLFSAKRDLAIARYDYIINMLSLRQAAGTLSEEDVKLANNWLG